MSGDSYQVGYKKPPVKNQFKPGNQAARGRKRPSKKPAGLSIPENIEKALLTRRKIKRGDQIIEMLVEEILVERLIQMVTTGSARDLKMVIDLIQMSAPSLLAAPMQEFAVRYHHAEGSTVPLPPLGLWKAK